MGLCASVEGGKPCECSQVESTAPEDMVEARKSLEVKKTRGSSRKGVFTREELEQSFYLFDLDKDGDLDSNELAGLMEHIGIKYTVMTLNAVKACMDPDGSGEIEKEEFIAFFEGKSKKLGTKKILQQAMKKRGFKSEEPEMKKARNCYITHVMSSESNGLKWCRWFAGCCVFADLSVAGPNNIGDDEEGQEQVPANDCEIYALFIDKSSSVVKTVIDEMNDAVEKGSKISIFFEVHFESVDEVLDRLCQWKNECPAAFEVTPTALSMHFISDSEQMALHAVHDRIGREFPLLGDIRPPGADVGDFEELNMPEIGWVKPEWVLATKRGDGSDLPPDAFDPCASTRPCFVSYAEEQPTNPGLSEKQRDCFRKAVEISRLRTRNMFIDQLSLKRGDMMKLHEDKTVDPSHLAKIISLCRFVIISDVDAEAQDARPFLSRGKNFMETTLAILTGDLAPCYQGQFLDLDKAIGDEIGTGVNLRKFFRDGVDKPKLLINQLCGFLRTREFRCREEGVFAENLLRRVLERHPRLVQNEAIAKLSGEAD